MRRDRSSPRPRARLARRLLAWIAGAALAGAAPAGAADVTGRADLSWGEDSTTGAASDYLRQTYKLDYRHQVTDPTSYQLTVRYRDDRGTLTALGERNDLRYRLLEPTASLQHRMEDWGMAVSFRRTEEENLLADVGGYVHRTIQRVSSSLYVRPFDRGEVAVYGDRLEFRTSNVDTLDQRTGIAFRYNTGAFRLDNEFRLQQQEDRIAQLSRASIGPRITAAYAKTFDGGSTLGAQYIVDYFLTQQDALASAPVSVPVEVQFGAGLFTIDNLPLDTVAMPSETRLVDRNFDASAGIAIGPSGSSFDNIGLDMGRFVTLDLLRIHVRDAAGAPVAQGGAVTWTAYSSQDGLRWAEIEGAATGFDVGLSAYVVSFPPLSARFFKVVNFGVVTTVETFVTELQPFVHDTVQPHTTKRAHSLRQGLSLSLSGKLTPKLTLDYSGLVNADLFAPDRGPDGWSTDVTNGATATIGPFGDFLYTAGETFTLAQDPGGVSQSSSVTTGSIRYRPIERYDTTLTAQLGRQRFEAAYVGSITTTDVRASLWNRLDPWDALRLGFGGGAGRQEYKGGATTDYVLGSAYAHADLASTLWLRFQSSLQWSVNDEGVVPVAAERLPVVRVVSYQLHTLEARWQPNVQLGLLLKVGWVASYAGEGLVQSYQANWSPFPGGAVQFAFYYSQDIDPLTARTLQRISATPRWQINRHAQLQVSYNNTRQTGDLPVHQESVYVMFSLVL